MFLGYYHFVCLLFVLLHTLGGLFLFHLFCHKTKSVNQLMIVFLWKLFKQNTKIAFIVYFSCRRAREQLSYNNAIKDLSRGS